MMMVMASVLSNLPADLANDYVQYYAKVMLALHASLLNLFLIWSNDSWPVPFNQLDTCPLMVRKEMYLDLQCVECKLLLEFHENSLKLKPLLNSYRALEIP